MVSLKKHIEQEKEDLTSWLIGIVILLLEATALHSVDHDADEHAEFRRQIHKPIEKFELTTEGFNTLIIAGKAVRALQTHNRSVERFIRNLSAEKQAIISAMTESFLKLANTGELARQTLRGRLCACLLRQESRYRKPPRWILARRPDTEANRPRFGEAPFGLRSSLSLARPLFGRCYVAL
jgi:hypothetical protein